jgi:hypothetical protein
MGKSPGLWKHEEEAEMRQATTPQTPSIGSDLGTLAGLYRTVFWMIGRKSQYGRIWPQEAEMAGLDRGSDPDRAVDVESPVFKVESRPAVEVGAKE